MSLPAATDVRTFTHVEYLWLRVFAALEGAYPEVKPAAGRMACAEAVRRHDAWRLRGRR